MNCPKLVERYLRWKAKKMPQQQSASDTVAAAEDFDDFVPMPWAVTVALDLAVADPSTLTAQICKQAGISRRNVAAQFAFVPCETYSVADYSNSGRGFFYRDHKDPTRPPRPDPGPKRDKAVLHDTLVNNVLSTWLNDREEGYSYKVFMENPRGMLQSRPFVVAKAAALGLTKALVSYCAYRHPFKKPTNVWSDSSWVPKGITGTGRCDYKCGQGFWKNGRYRHKYGLAQEPIRGCRGKGATRFKNSIPPALCKEWMKAVVKDSAPGQHTIIDLCAGFQSLKPYAIANGFNYVAVDVLGDRNIVSRLSPVDHSKPQVALGA